MEAIQNRVDSNDIYYDSLALNEVSKEVTDNSLCGKSNVSA